MTRMIVVPNGRSRCWDVRHEGMPEIRELFGTDTVPTPYGLGVAREAVVKAVQKRNPGVDVA